MALGSSYAKSLARKAPKPDVMLALEAEPEGDDEPMVDDEDADDAVAMSAYEDFAKAAGFQAKPETFRAFKELVRAIK